MHAVPWFSLGEPVWWMLLFITLGPTLGTYALNAYALERAPSSIVGAFITLQPVIAITLSFVFLDIQLKPQTLLWGGPVILGVLLCSLSSTQKRPHGDSSPEVTNS